jgi:hypothetical protein
MERIIRRAKYRPSIEGQFMPPFKEGESIVIVAGVGGGHGVID